MVVKEIRSFNAKWEVREEDGRPVIEGYAAVFNSESQDLGGFIEIIEPGCFSETILAEDIPALLNHDPNIVFGRNVAGTVELREDEHGLFATIRPPDWAGGYVESIGRGDFNGMSFGFYDAQDSWQGNVRTLKRCKLTDVSVVTYPAYLDTEVAVRSWKQEQKRNMNANRLALLRLLEAESD